MIPEAERRERGQAQFHWRLPADLLELATEEAQLTGQTLGQWLTALVSEALDLEPGRLHHTGMAKGSGGVGKSKGKASVSGAKATSKAPKFGPGDVTAANLQAAAEALPASQTYHGKPFLGPLLAQFGTTPQAQAKKLLEMHMDGKITLTRADLVEAMNPKMVSSSEISRPGTHYTYHFIEFD